MSNLSSIIQQLKVNQSSFLQKIELIESGIDNASEEVLRDLIQDARELHEGTVLLSYLVYNEDETPAPVQEDPILPFEEASNQPVSIDSFINNEKESSEEEELINALDSAIANTNLEVERSMPEPEIIQEIEAVKNIIQEEEQIQSSTEEEIPTQEELNADLETSISSVISMHSSENTFSEKIQVEDNSLAARLAKKKIENLSSAIGINEKFLFTNELFDGNTEQFLKEIGVLNQQNSMEQANQYLEGLAVKNEWNVEEQPYLKLVALVGRKYI